MLVGRVIRPLHPPAEAGTDRGRDVRRHLTPSSGSTS
jgi:hypothetical protein